MISKKDILIEYSIYNDYALTKHTDLDKKLVEDITETAIKLYEDPEGKDFEEDMVINSMTDEQKKEYFILESITRWLNDVDPYLCDNIEKRKEDIKDSCYLEIPVEEVDDDFSEYPGTDFNYDIDKEDDDYECNFD